MWNYRESGAVTKLTSDIPDFTFTFHAAQREKFRTDRLAEEWREKYPLLFEDEDLALLRTAHQRMFHFFEGLSAILLYEATGYRSLVESYTAVPTAVRRAARQVMVWAPPSSAGGV